MSVDYTMLMAVFACSLQAFWLKKLQLKVCLI